MKKVKLGILGIIIKFNLILIISLLILSFIKSNNLKISIIPCNNISNTEINSLVLDLKTYFNNNYNFIPEISISNNIQLTKQNRYYARDLIEKFKTKNDEIQILVLNEDIYIYKNNNKWGILGLSKLDTNTCVISTFRVKNRKNLWKLAIHEFNHTYFKYHHCPNNDKHCIMKDAKGHANLEQLKYICNKCSKIIKYPAVKR